MSDEDDFRGPLLTPAIPSRATGELKPVVPTFSEKDGVVQAINPVRGLPKRKVKKAKKMLKKRVQLPRRSEGTDKRRFATQPAQTARSPNRSLEAKLRLDSVLTILDDLSKAELGAFTASLKAIKVLSKPSVARVIAALNKVYG